MATTYYEALQKLYVAYFNRPADPGGLAYWEGVVEKANGNTAAVNASFAASTEYKDTYKGLTNEQILDKVYTNLFGHAADPTGKAYYLPLLDSNKLTIDLVVSEVAKGALGSDATVFGNKVKAAQAFTTAVDTEAEIKGYSGEDANAIAKDFITGVTDDASLADALTPATLNAAVSDAVKAGTPFTLVGALAALDAANDAKADFLAGLDLDDDPDTDTVDADVAAAVVAAEGDVAAEVPGYDTDPVTGNSDGVNAALLADEIDARAAKLKTDQATLKTANAEVAKVAGLANAIANLTAASTAVEGATEANDDAVAAQAGAETSYNTLHGVTVTIDPATGTVKAGATDLIVVKNGALALATGVTETDNKGITALLNSIKAHMTAEGNLEAALGAELNAKIEVSILDLDPVDSVANLTALDTAMTIVTPAKANAPTASEVETEIVGLKQLLTAANEALAKDPADAALIAAQAAAQDKYDDFITAVNTFLTNDADLKAAAVLAAQTLVKNDQTDINDLAKAVAALAEAKANEAKLGELQDAIDAAGDFFTDNDYAAPVTLGAFQASSSGNDIFLAGKVDSTVTSFGLQGKDALFIGKEFTLNTTGDLTKGDNAKLEVFFVKSGSSTIVELETKAFGSASAAEAEIKITLTGVSPEQLKLADGIITLA